MHDDNATAKRAVGRPRDPELEARIKAASLRVLSEYGFSGLTLERLCAEAKIPKATFYRRWTTPRELASQAFNERFEHGLLSDTGDAAADLRVFADVLVDLYTDPLLGRCLLFIIAESKVHADVGCLVTSAQNQRRTHNVSMLETALAAQGLKPSLSAKVILNVLNGVAFNIYAAARPTSSAEFGMLIDTLLRSATGDISEAP